MRAWERGDDERGLEIFVTAVSGREAFARLTETMRQQARDNVRALKAQLRAGFPPFTERDARSISWPTLLVTGERSAVVLHCITDRLQRALPRVERADIPNASHLVYEDDPEAFNRSVLEFLGRYGG
jgi:pimeloyl-ACP methyl ester carboxylesterase